MPDETFEIKDLREIFHLWSKNVDINCYTKILEYKTNFKAQLIWILILLGSTGATFYFIIRSIIDFFDYDVVTKTSIINQKTTPFPTVTFCDSNPFTSLESQTLMESIAEANGIQLNWSNITNMLFWLTIYNATSPFTSDSIRQKLGLTIDQIKCTYNRKDCKNDLHWHWSTENGNCFQFNSGLNKANQKINVTNALRYGKEFGLNIEVLLSNENKYVTSKTNGLVVFVHNSSFKRFKKGVFVGPGKQTFIEVERSLVQKQPSPYSDCTELSTYSSELYNYLIESGQKYMQENCFNLCIQKLHMKNCNCFYPGFQNLNTYLRPCINITDFNCLDKTYFNFNMNECEKSFCPLECETLKYDLALSSLDYPSPSYYYSFIEKNEKEKDFFKEKLKKNLSIEMYKSAAVSFNVFYTSLQYTLFTESPKMSIADLFSQIGGALGLFVSFSIFTLFELMELIILMICKVFR